MLKKLMITTAAGALLATAAWAQSPSSEPSSSSSPPAASSTQSTGGAMGSGSVVSSQKPDQWLASKFRGTDVVGSDDQKVGDVSDILFDKSGKIDAFVVSVGGFLGIGSKDVALPPTAFQVVPRSSGSSTTGAGGGAATTGAAGNDPNDVRLKVSMSKDELKNAQAFEAYKAPSSTGTAGGGNRPAGGGAGGGAR